MYVEPNRQNMMYEHMYNKSKHTRTQNTHTHKTQSLLNEVELEKVQKVANRTQEALDEGKYAEATQLWGEAEDVIESVRCDYYIQYHTRDKI